MLLLADNKTFPFGFENILVVVSGGLTSQQPQDPASDRVGHLLEPTIGPFFSIVRSQEIIEISVAAVTQQFILFPAPSLRPEQNMRTVPMCERFFPSYKLRTRCLT